MICSHRKNVHRFWSIPSEYTVNLIFLFFLSALRQRQKSMVFIIPTLYHFIIHDVGFIQIQIELLFINSNANKTNHFCCFYLHCKPAEPNIGSHLEMLQVFLVFWILWWVYQIMESLSWPVQVCCTSLSWPKNSNIYWEISSNLFIPLVLNSLMFQSCSVPCRDYYMIYN